MKKFLADMAATFTSVDCSHVMIVDALSEYATLVDAEAAPVITIRKSNDHSTTAAQTSQNGVLVAELTELNNDNEESRTLRAGIGTDGKITLKFPDGYKLENGWTYTVTVKIKPSEKAYIDYQKSGYGEAKGEANTDAPGNITSSNQPGFYSNTEATLTYTSAGEVQPEKTYPKPVIQVKNGTLQITKEVSGGLDTTFVSDETFQFTITRLNQDGSETLTNFSGNYTAKQTGQQDQSITFTNGVAQDVTITGVGTLVIENLPAGIYRVTESTTNINDAGDDYYFVGVVYSSTDGKVTVNAGSAASTLTVTNNYEHYKTVTITKEVDNGTADQVGMGDRTKLFEFTTSINNKAINKNEQGETTLTTLDDPSSDEDQVTAAWTNDGYSLAHGGQIVIKKLKAEDLVAFAERDYSGEGYTTSYTVKSGSHVIDSSVPSSPRAGTIDLDSDIYKNYDDITITFTNNRQVVAPTGLESNHTTPYVLMITAAGMAGLALIGGVVARRVRRRRWQE